MLTSNIFMKKEEKTVTIFFTEFLRVFLYIYRKHKSKHIWKDLWTTVQYVVNGRKVALFTHKILNDSTNISTIFHRPLTQASEIHTYNTRFASKLNFHRPKANNNYGTSTFAFVSSQLWKTIPTNIKRLPYTSFCYQYKLYLLNMQSSEQPVY